MNTMDNLKSDPGLLERLHQVAGRKPSVQTVQEQRVSFVYGLVGVKSGVTKDRVRQVLAAQDGGAVEGQK